MQCIKLPGLIALVIIYLPSCETCAVGEVPTCEHYSLIKGVKFQAFIPEHILYDVCRQMLTAIACAYTRGRLNECHLYYRLPFDTQLGVINTVCVHRRQEYMKSSQCFSRHVLQSHINTACLQVFTVTISSSTDPCSTLKQALDCARTQVLMTDGCDSVDSDLMQDLVETFLRPSMQNFKCSSLTTKAGESKQEHVGDESSQGKINSAPVSNSASQQPFLAENLKTKHIEGTDGEEIKTSKYGSPETLAQYTSHDTTVTYLGDITLSSQSVSWTNTDDRHRGEQTSPEITSPHNQDGIQQSQGSANGLEPGTMKSSTKYSTNSAILAREYATLGIWPTVSTVPESEGLDKTEMWVTESSTLGLKLENTEHDNKNANKPLSQSNKAVKVMALKSTQRSGNDATTQFYRTSLRHMLLSLIIALVLFAK